MGCLTTAMVQLSVAAIVTVCASAPGEAEYQAAKEGRPRAVTEDSVPEESPKLKMVIIRASAPEVERLRRMSLDIVRVRPATGPRETPSTKSDFLQRRFIVEAVVPSALATRLTELGYELIDVP